MAGRAIGVYAPGVGGYAFDRGVGGLWRGGRGADAAGEVARPRSCVASQRRGPAGLECTASGIAYRGCHLGFCAAPQLRGCAGLGAIGVYCPGITTYGLA